MFLDHIENSASYAAIHPCFPTAFAHLRELSMRGHLPDGHIDLEGDQLFAIIANGHGKTKAGARMETHRRHIDIQYTADGSDLIGWMPVGECHEPLGYDVKKDVEFYGDVASQWIEVPAGQFAIFLPHDAHAPMAGNGGAVKKIVIKVAI